MLFSGFGIDIIERGGELYMRYDDGSIVTQSRVDPITRVEAAKAQTGEKDACEVIPANDAVRRRLLKPDEQNGWSLSEIDKVPLSGRGEGNR